MDGKGEERRKAGRQRGREEEAAVGRVRKVPQKGYPAMDGKVRSGEGKAITEGREGESVPEVDGEDIRHEPRDGLWMEDDLVEERGVGKQEVGVDHVGVELKAGYEP
jgi:hypothetical protein